MKMAFEGKRLVFDTFEDFKKGIENYKINPFYSNSNITLKNEKEFLNYCSEIQKNCIYSNFIVNLDYKNEKIRWIGLNSDSYSYGAITLYKDEKQKCSVLLDVMTFTEAAKMWNLGDSTLRSVVRQDRLIEGLDYRKSGNTWVITTAAMEKLYGKI